MASQPTKQDKLPGAKPVYSSTIAAVRLVVHGDVVEQTLPERPGKPAMTLYKQACVVIGGTRQINTTITAMEKALSLSAGLYTLSNDSISVGQYDRLEVRFRPEYLVRVGDFTAEHEALFEARATDISDLMR